MPSQTRRLSSRERSAAKKIQTKFRNRKTKKKQVSALQRIENKVRSIKIKNYEKERSRRHEEEVAKFRNISTQRNKRKEVAQKFRTRIKNIINNKEKENVCAICLDKMMPNDNVTSLECGHRFHSDCIRRSLTATQGTCPLCRTVITNIPYSPRSESEEEEEEEEYEPLILDPILREQYILERTRQLDFYEREIEELRPRVPDQPEIPNIHFLDALSNLYSANHTEYYVRRLYNEASYNYNNFRNLNINDEILEEDVTNMFFRTSELLTLARDNSRNARRICNHIGDIEFAQYM